MELEVISEIVKDFVSDPIKSFVIDKEIFIKENGREIFNQIIRKNVEKKFGVYIWLDVSSNKIVYIGMAGKIKTDGSLGDHTIQNRLLASRGRDKSTKKDIQTNDYIRNFMVKQNIEQLKFHIIYTKPGEVPSHIEALLLYNFYKSNQCLPILNNSF